MYIKDNIGIYIKQMPYTAAHLGDVNATQEELIAAVLE